MARSPKLEYRYDDGHQQATEFPEDRDREAIAASFRQQLETWSAEKDEPDDEDQIEEQLAAYLAGWDHAVETEEK